MNKMNNHRKQIHIMFAVVFVALSLVAGIVPVESEAAQRSVLEDASWIGDLDVMKQKGAIRILAPVSNSFFLVDGFHKYGIIPERVTAFEQFLNKDMVSGSFLRVVTIPVSRDTMIDRLTSGYGDILMANLTVTPDRLQVVDFADPVATGINEIVVAAPDAAILHTLDDLSGKMFTVRRHSSYYEHLVELNESFAKKGLEAIKIRLIHEGLEDDVLLAMVNDGILAYAVMDQWKPEFWRKIYPDFVYYPGIRLASGGEIAWAVRKDSPQLKKSVSQFVNYYKEKFPPDRKKLHGVSDKDLLEFSNLNPEMWAHYQEYYSIFEKANEKYDIPAPWLAGLAYVSSRFDQEKIGPHGELGMMQLAPYIAREPEIDIEDIAQVEGNVEATAKYLRYLIDTYFADKGIDPVDQRLFAMAAYYTGPEKISTMRWTAGQMGQNSNKWFNEVAVVVSRQMGRETERFVMAVGGAALTYKLALESGKKKWRIEE